MSAAAQAMRVSACSTLLRCLMRVLITLRVLGAFSVVGLRRGSFADRVYDLLGRMGAKVDGVPALDISLHHGFIGQIKSKLIFIITSCHWASVLLFRLVIFLWLQSHLDYNRPSSKATHITHIPTILNKLSIRLTNKSSPISN